MSDATHHGNDRTFYDRISAAYDFIADANERAARVAGVQALAVRPGEKVVEIGDRRTAIREALRRAGTGDIVLIAGKGHETGQEIAGEVHPFDDRDVVREELGAR